MEKRPYLDDKDDSVSIEAISILQKAISILAEQTFNCQILENILCSQQVIFELLLEKSNQNELSAATSALLKMGNSSLVMYSSLSSSEFFSKINSTISSISNSKIRRFQGPFWNADTQFYRKRADYQYTQLFSQDSLALEKMISTHIGLTEENFKKIGEYPVAFIVLNGEQRFEEIVGAASIVTPEEKLIDLLFSENLFGLPTQLGILIPIFLNEEATEHYYKHFPLSRHFSAKLAAFPQSSGMNFTYFELTPILKIIILSRVSKVLQIINSLSKRDPITNIICLQYLLSHIRSCAISFNIFSVDSNRQHQDSLNVKLQQLVTQQIFQTEELLCISLRAA